MRLLCCLVLFLMVAGQASASLLVNESPGTFALWRFNSTYQSADLTKTYTPDNVLRTPKMDLSLANGATITSDGSGWDGQAGVFDGTNDYGVAAWNKDVNKNIAISMAFNTSALGAERYLVEIASTIRLYMSATNKLTFTIYDSTGTGKSLVTTASLSANTWYSVNAQYDKQGIMKLQLRDINGNIISGGDLTMTHGTGTVNYFSANIVIGAYRGNSKYWQGKIDEVKLNNMTPEPATVALLGLGGLLLRKRK